jgi:membrane protease YdiL (CAAX protease family)
MQSKPVERVTLINITLFVEAFLLLAATIWSQCAEIPLGQAFSSHLRTLLIGAGAGLLLAAVSLLLLKLGKSWKVLADLRAIIVEQVAPIFAQLNWIDVLSIALVSGFCEEVFFRGVMQPQLGLALQPQGGLFATSIIFGLFHCPSFKHISYGLWAFVAGCLLGFLYQYTGSLWAPIIAHAVSNAISLMFLRYGIKPSTPPLTS